MSFLTDDFPLTMEREAGLEPHYPPVAVGFGLNPILDEAKTAAAGHEVYGETVFVRIAVPGDRNSLFFQPATDQHKKRFPQAWAAYTAREQQKPKEGLPVDMWAPISRSVALNLKAMHIHTVEALAAVHEGHIDKLGTNGRELRAKAIAFLEQAKDSAAVTKAAAKEKQLQDQITALQNQIAAMQRGEVNPEEQAKAARKPRAGK